MPKIAAFKSFSEKWSKRFVWVSMFMVAGMLLLTVFDIVGSKLRMPLPGGYYVTGLLLLMVCAFGVAQAEVMGRHIRIDMLLLRLPERIKGVFGVFSNIVSAAMMAAVIIISFRYGLYLHKLGISTYDLEIPLFPFPFVICLGCIPFFLVLVGEIFESVRQVREI